MEQHTKRYIINHIPRAITQLERARTVVKELSFIRDFEEACDKL